LSLQKYSKLYSLIPSWNGGNASNQIESRPLQSNNKLVVKVA